MKPKLVKPNQSLPSPRLTGDAQPRPVRYQSSFAEGSMRGATWSTGRLQRSTQQTSQCASCSTRKSLVVCAASQANISTRLLVPDLKLQFGERIKCVGQSAELGSWYLNAAPLLSWTEGDNWVHHLQLPTGSHEFKLLITRDDGTTHWEKGQNRTIEVPERIDGILEVKCVFEQTHETEISTVPRPVKDQDMKAIKAAQSDHAHSSSDPFRNEIAAGDVPDAMEGDSAEREPDTLRDAKNYPGQGQQKKKDDKGREEAMEGVSPPSSDPLEETEPSPDDRSVQKPTNYAQRGAVFPRSSQNNYSNGNYNGSSQNNYSNGNSTKSWGNSSQNGRHQERAWGQGSQLNGASRNGANLNGAGRNSNGADIKAHQKNNFGSNGKLEIYGGAEAKELEDGSVLVKFPPDDNGEDILKLVQRLLGYYETK